jgi:hypothetical protein
MGHIGICRGRTVDRGMRPGAGLRGPGVLPSLRRMADSAQRVAIVTGPESGIGRTVAG